MYTARIYNITSEIRIDFNSYTEVPFSIPETTHGNPVGKLMKKAIAVYLNKKGHYIEIMGGNNKVAIIENLNKARRSK